MGWLVGWLVSWLVGALIVVVDGGNGVVAADVARDNVAVLMLLSLFLLLVLLI